MDLLVHAFNGLSRGSDTQSTRHGQPQARLRQTNTHSHEILDLPDRVRDGLVSLYSLAENALLSAHHQVSNRSRHFGNSDPISHMHRVDVLSPN